MASGRIKALALLLTISLVFLSFGLFAALLGLGSWSIIESINQDSCSDCNLTCLSGCEVQSSLNSEGSGEQLPNSVLPWYSWMGGCTGVGVVWTIVTTLAFQSLLWTITVFSDQDNQPYNDIGMQVRSGSAHSSEEEEEETTDSRVLAKQTITILGANVSGHVTKQELDKKPPLRKLTVGGVFGVFFSLLALMLGFLCLLWGIAISYGNLQRDNVFLSTYITVEILTAVLMPICFFIFGILFAGVLDFITWGRVDLRTLIPKFLPVVKFEAGINEEKKNFDYWVIEDTFYFQIDKRDHSKEANFANSFDKAWSTWSLNFIVCLGVHLSIAYFVDITLDEEDTIQTPEQCDTIDSTYQCFEAVTLEPISDCTSFSGTAYCFKFLRFGVDANIISSAATAFAFHLVAAAAFTWLFNIMKFLLQIKPSRWWGLLYLITGILGFLGAIPLIAVWTTGFAADQINEIANFNVINVAQFCMVCEYLFIIGLLLVAASWWENVPVPAPVKKELVHFEDTSRKDVTVTKSTRTVEAGKDPTLSGITTNI